jgi:two-component system, OmpR family, response regulator PhoP
MVNGETLPIRVAVCEDDEDLRDILLQGLGDQGLRVFGVPSAETLGTFLASAVVDILLLDIGLPGEDGYSVARRLHRDHPSLGIIMITARGGVDDRVRGLAGGADLYFVKPVELAELVAAIRSLHRRLVPAAASVAPGAEWQLDRIHSTLCSPGGARVPLVESERRLLAELAANPGGTLDKARLLASLGWDSKHRVEALISRLRKKVALASPAEILPIRARHGDGYAFLATIRIL